LQSEPVFCAKSAGLHPAGDAAVARTGAAALFVGDGGAVLALGLAARLHLHGIHRSGHHGLAAHRHGWCRSGRGLGVAFHAGLRRGIGRAGGQGQSDGKDGGGEKQTHGMPPC